MESITFNCDASQYFDYVEIFDNICDFFREKDITSYRIKEPYRHGHGIAISNIIVTDVEITRDLCHEFEDRYKIICYIFDNRIMVRRNLVDKPYIIRVLHPSMVKEYQFSHYTNTTITDVMLTSIPGNILKKRDI